MSGCKHPTLCFEPSPHAQEVGYKKHIPRPGSKALPEVIHASTFPAPLVLPGDELSFDPKYGPQSVRSWLRIRDRIAAESGRRTIYVVRPPEYAAESNHVRGWAIPDADTGNASLPAADRGHMPPAAEPMREYLEAFYHALIVKMYDGPQLKFMPWTEARKKKGHAGGRERIGLNIGSEAIGIRHRPSKDGLYSGQLNLNDLLDAAIAILPEDAYALLMLVNHDLYEDEPDDFCCGRAYGGNRVAVVCTSRYNPWLDKLQETETEHVWPLSHCQAFVDASCSGEAIEPPTKKPKRKGNGLQTRADTAMDAAVSAYMASVPAGERSAAAKNALWFARICKTASHEVGHIVGMDHCVYYACVMQGTAGLTEDGAQPPYLCPIDLEKTLTATGGNVVDRYEKLLRFCEKWGSKAGGEMWAAWAAWLSMRLKELPSPGGSTVSDPIELSP